MNIPDRLLEAIHRYTSGIATDEETSLVNEWYHSFPEGDVEVPEEVFRLREQVRDRIYGRLLKTIEFSRERKNTVNVVHMRYIAAAVVLLLLGAGVWWFSRGVGEEHAIVPLRIAQDIPPGANKAILTLSDGRRIGLDSKHTDTLARQGMSDVIQSAGQLRYERVTGEQAVVAYNTVATPRGGKFSVVLPDGTRVWLNAISSLRFPTAFTGSQRRVELDGEAYFEVVADKQKPFLVDTKDQLVTVLGTHFNISCYPDEAATNTTLLEGRVSVSAKQGSQQAVLAPGEQSVVAGGRLSVKPGDAEAAIAWKNDEFDFRSEDLPSIMRKIARWYNVDIEYEGQGFDDILLGGWISQSKNISAVLTVLQLTGKVQFKVEGRKIIVLHP